MRIYTPSGFSQAELDARAKATGRNVDECVALYFHDPLVSMEQYGRLIEDAAARDADQEAVNA